jgi:hypothetical protein
MEGTAACNYFKQIHGWRVFSENTSDDTWPSTTQEKCRWCIHSIEGYPFGIPQKYDDKLRKYYLFGMFCSVNCARAYNFREGSGNKQLVDQWITRLARERPWCTPINKMAPAPSRYVLGIFTPNGMSIEEFRKDHKSIYSTMQFPFLRVHQLIVEQKREKDAQIQIMQQNRVNMKNKAMPIQLDILSQTKLRFEQNKGFMETLPKNVSVSNILQQKPPTEANQRKQTKK